MTSPAIYVRQSIDHPEGIDRALARARQLVESRGWPAAVEFKDNAVSASSVRDETTDWGRMLARVRQGEFDVIVGVDVDRLMRSIQDLALLIGLGVKVVTVDGEIDLTTADGEFRATMLAGIARFETRRKGERQVRGNEARVTNGLPVPGKRRYGFEPGNIVERPDEAENVRALYTGVAAGDSIRSWAERLGKKTVRVREILVNPSYAGWVVRQGERFDAHESVARVVDRGLWETVQMLISDPSRKTYAGNQPKHLASGIARCSVCNTAMVKVGPNYVCPGGAKGHPSIKVETLDKLIAGAVQTGLMLWADNPVDREAEAQARERIAAIDESIRVAQDLALIPNADVAHLRGRIVELGALKAEAVTELSRALDAALPLMEGVADRESDAWWTPGADFDAAWKDVAIDRKRELARRLIVSLKVEPGRGTERVKIHLRVPSIV